MEQKMTEMAKPNQARACKPTNTNTGYFTNIRNSLNKD